MFDNLDYVTKNLYNVRNIYLKSKRNKNYSFFSYDTRVTITVSCKIYFFLKQLFK